MHETLENQSLFHIFCDRFLTFLQDPYSKNPLKPRDKDGLTVH